MHLGHSISSGDRTDVKYAKISFWSSFHIFIAEFGHISSQLKNVFLKYCCVFYGSPLWPLEGDMIQSLCVDWRKVLSCVWSVNNRTSLSNQFPLILSLKKRFIKFIRNCLSLTLLLKLFLMLPFLTQCLTLIIIMDVHLTVMASYL